MTKRRKKYQLPPSKKLRLKDNHTWTAPKGYKILVLDRGAVSFNIPDSWLLVQMEPALTVHDRQPPDDNARLSVSFWQFPPDIDWSGLPLPQLLEQSTEGKDMNWLERGTVVKVARSDLEMVWAEHRFLDEEQQREAYSRVTLARGWGVHVVLSFDYWVDEAAKFLPVWEEVVRSLQLGRTIEDPTKGAVLH